MLDELLGARPVEAILAGRARITLGGQDYLLPDLANRPNREWLESIDGRLRGLLEAVDAANDDLPAIMSALQGASEELLDVLIAYDAHGILPAREVLDETATPREILLGVLGVWQAANPLVGIALAGIASGIRSQLPAPTSSSPTPTAGRRATSRKH